MSMDVEEMIRAQPLDAVVLLGGCDKTLPAMIMCDICRKTIRSFACRTMITSKFENDRYGCLYDCRRYWSKYREGENIFS